MQFAGSTPPPHLPLGAIHNREGLAPVSPDQLDLNSDLLRTSGRGGGGGVLLKDGEALLGGGQKYPLSLRTIP